MEVDSTVTGAPQAVSHPVAAAVDRRGWLRLALAAIWVLDGLLQYQPFMFTAGFAKTLTATASGNPGVVASPITWSAGIIAAHPVWTNAVFATIQLALGIGIALRPTMRLALAGSIVWSLAVWWLGEGLGGVLTGTADPLAGAPGAVILYALLAVLLWPVADEQSSTTDWIVVADRPVGASVARAVWVVLWGSLAYFALLPADRANQAMHDMIAGMVSGQPRWLVVIDNVTAGFVDGRGVAASIVVAVLFAVVAVGVFAPPEVRRVVLVVAIVLAAFIWVVGEAFGNLFTAQATDVNSGPLLALLALTYWPTRYTREESR